MKRQSIFLGCVAGALMPVLAGGAVAQELSFQPRVSIGYQSYVFDIDDGEKIETDYILGGLGLTVQRGRFFVDLYGQTNLTKAEDNEDGFAEEDDIVIDRESEVDRFELNATLGYAITPNISAFGGVKYATNDVKTGFSSDDPDIDALIENDDLDISVDYIGPFVGTSYALPVADVGAVALSGSIAYLFGETTTNIEIEILDIDEEDDLDGSAFGFNIGAAWIGSLAPLSPNLADLGYTVGVDYSQYEFKDDGDKLFDEETLRFKVDVKYSF